MADLSQTNNLLKADFYDLLGGLNITDSPFKVMPTQAVAGYNYEYVATGGVKKRNGHTKLNSVADTQLQALGYALHSTPSNVKTMLRAAGTKLQSLNTSTGVSTNITDDTVSAGTSIFTSTQPVVSSQFNTAAATTSWFAGGGISTNNLIGYNGTVFTTNGAASPAGTISGVASGADGTLAAGDYYYAVALMKGSTQAVSNAALDLKVTVGATNHVVITLSSITAFDQTQYTQIWIYRSVISGSLGFTAGSVIAKLTSSSTSYTDKGTSIADSINVPRANSTVLDNSQLPSGTFNTLVRYKQRLVTASGSSLYLSDLNKPESWPTTNVITVPSGGSITALGVIYFNTPTTSATDEYLVIFKEREMWVLTGDALVGASSTEIDPWKLKFIDYTGCIAQPLIVAANGFIFWIDYRGAYMWEGSGKPTYLSRPIEYDFGIEGDIDRSNLGKGCGAFFRKQNQIVWFLSSVSLGLQKLTLKLDLRLTMQSAESAGMFLGKILDGVFIKDSLPFPIYACTSVLPTFDETLYAGDITGNTWKLFDNQNSDNATSIAFSYRTPPEDFDLKGVAKRYHKVVVWCRESTIAQLTLNYWTDYKITGGTQFTASTQVSNDVTIAYWDQATWDNAYFDQNLVTYKAVVFNLNNAEGDALTLEFVQASANAPMTIIGYSVLYTTVGMRK